MVHLSGQKTSTLRPEDSSIHAQPEPSAAWPFKVPDSATWAGPVLSVDPEPHPTIVGTSRRNAARTFLGPFPRRAGRLSKWPEPSRAKDLRCFPGNRTDWHSPELDAIIPEPKYRRPLSATGDAALRPSDPTLLHRSHRISSDHSGYIEPRDTSAAPARQAGQQASAHAATAGIGDRARCPLTRLSRTQPIPPMTASPTAAMASGPSAPPTRVTTGSPTR